MKKKIVLLLILLLSFVIAPVASYASSKDNNKITVYMFRGKGCAYCKAFLNFINDINGEYGKYFELKSYEVWNDSNNSELLQTISGFLENEAKGVPYIIIGKEVFPGYASSYDEDIKKAIKDLYNTNKNDRYDVFKDYESTKGKLSNKYTSKNLKQTLSEEGIQYNEYKDDNESNKGVSSSSVIIWNLAFTIISTTIILLFVNSKFKKLNK